MIVTSGYLSPTTVLYLLVAGCDTHRNQLRDEGWYGVILTVAKALAMVEIATHHDRPTGTIPTSNQVVT